MLVDVLIEKLSFQGQEFPERSYDFIMTALSYSKSNWPEIRAVAATFIGE